MIKIVLAEDQTMLRGALATLLSLEHDIEVIAQAEDGDSAYKLVKQLNPDILVTDIEMPGMSGIELAEKITQENLTTNIVIVTTFAKSGYLQRAISAGVKGYLLKDTPSEELAETIRQVSQGRTSIMTNAGDSATQISDPLSTRDRQILRLVESGLTNKEIGEELHLSAGTVRNYLAVTTEKLNASNRIEAFRIAREMGWL